MFLAHAPTAADLTAIKNFWNALVAGLPNTLSLQVQGTGDIIESTTGQLTGVWAATQPAAVTGTSASGYAAPVGTLVHWLTPGIVNGRHVRGTTYIVPTVNQFEPGGTPVATWLTTLTTAATTLWGALGTDFSVYARKYDPPPGSSNPHRDGSIHAVTGVQVPDKSIVLRSRRD